MVNNTRVVIADDTEPILIYLEKILSKEDDFEVVGKAKDGEELINIIKEQKPDLVITDQEMPKCNGLDAIKKLNNEQIKTNYIIITGNTLIMSNYEKQLGVLKIIRKPIMDDRKFIEQIRNSLKTKDENKIIESKTPRTENTVCRSDKKHKNIKEILNKFFKGK